MFKPGQSGNPSGRPKGAAGLARAVKERVGENCEEIVDQLLAIARDPQTLRRERILAWSILLDRAAGKPHQSSSVNLAATAIALPAGWELMSNADRLAWADGLRQRALSGAPIGLLDDGPDE